MKNLIWMGEARGIQITVLRENAPVQSKSFTILPTTVYLVSSRLKTNKQTKP